MTTVVFLDNKRNINTTIFQLRICCYKLALFCFLFQQAYYETYSKDSLSLCVSHPVLLANDSYKFSCESNNKDSVASSAASYTESAVSGSMPTTPDVLLDANKTLQVALCPRRLSRDSGTGDVDEQNANTTEPYCDVEYEMKTVPCMIGRDNI